MLGPVMVKTPLQKTRLQNQIRISLRGLRRRQMLFLRRQHIPLLTRFGILQAQHQNGFAQAGGRSDLAEAVGRFQRRAGQEEQHRPAGLHMPGDV